MADTNARALQSLSHAAPWLFAVGGLGLALSFASADHQPPAPPPAPIVHLSTDGEDGLRVRGPHVAVDGIASLDVVPDVADITIQLAIERESPAEAVELMRQRREQLAAALAELGVEANELRTGHLQVTPVYDDYPRTPRIRAYSASITVVASVSEFELIGELLQAASEFDVRSMSTRFRSTELPEKKKRLRDMALVAARDKARQAADVLEVELGPVISIEEGSGSGSGGWGAQANFIANDYAQAQAPTQALVPGAISLSLTVNVEFALETPD